jgi:hypothetical protein
MLSGCLKLAEWLLKLGVDRCATEYAHEVILHFPECAELTSRFLKTHLARLLGQTSFL